MGGLPLSKKKKRAPVTDFISWFEIPAFDINQAVNFYNHIFEIDMKVNVTEVNSMALFPVTTGIGGAIIAGPGSVPSVTGPLLYLNAGDDLQGILSRIESVGGRIVMPKTLISKEAGYFAIFIDSQGNKLALYSKK